MPIRPTILHIVYVHGFQGDHTTFQSFPTDLHKALLSQFPPHIDLRSILYPTYKSKRPIAVAAQNFLNWLDTLPYGPVVLCGHSMGGLLVAEAATSQTHSAARRVVAVLAFDVPFLGMHPHVVISGIASLLPNKKGDSSERGSESRGAGLKSERQMNDEKHVNVPIDGTPSPSASQMSLTNAAPSSPNFATHPSNTPPPLPPRPPSHSQSSRPSPPPLSPSLNDPTTPAFISRTLNFLETHSNDPLVRFISKHHNDPLGAAKRWVVESFEFGVCMFDPKGLRDRYAALERWERPWVAFWTETMPGAKQSEEVTVGRDGGAGVEHADTKEKQEEGAQEERDATASLGRLLAPTLSETSTSSPPLSDTPPSSPEPTPPPEYGPLTKAAHKAAEKNAQEIEKQHEKSRKSREKAAKALRKQQDKELKALRKQHDSPHHFVVRPFKAPSHPTHRWEDVKIRGAKDEVEAHCGLFIRDVNWEYEAFVDRVSRVVQGWMGEIDSDIS